MRVGGLGKGEKVGGRKGEVRRRNGKVRNEK